MATTKTPVSAAKAPKDLPAQKPVKGGYVINWRPTQDPSTVNRGGGQDSGIIIDF